MDVLDTLRASVDRVLALAEKKGVPPRHVTQRDYAAAHPSLPSFADFTAARAEAEKEYKAANPVPVDVIPEGHRLRGVSTLVDPKGNIQAQWVKTTNAETQGEIVARLIRELPSTIKPRKASITNGHASEPDTMAVYPLGDPHVGLLAWAKESGADFDLKIAEDLMVGAMRDLVLRGPRAAEALIVNLGDFFHADNGDNHTTHGTHTLDVDGRTPRVLQVGVRIMVSLIDAALEHHKRVTVDNRIGNHDAYTALWLSIALGAYYRNEPRVTIPVSETHRSYYEFGTNLIGCTHGDRAKANDLGAIMAAEKPEAWGRTRHRLWLTGHVHHSAAKEYRGVRVESFRTLAARDSWHAAQGYVAGRDMHRITLHRTRGETGREIVNVDSLLRSGT